MELASPFRAYFSALSFFYSSLLAAETLEEEDSELSE